MENQPISLEFVVQFIGLFILVAAPLAGMLWLWSRYA